MSSFEGWWLGSGSWWGYAEGDATVIGIVVAVIVGFAVAYLVTRMRKGRRKG